MWWPILLMSWKKSCTSWDIWHPRKNEILHINWGFGRCLRFRKTHVRPSIRPPGQKELVEGKIKNVAAPQIAIKYWNMPSDATLRAPWICYNNRRCFDGCFFGYVLPIITGHWKNASPALVVAFQIQPFSTSIIIGEEYTGWMFHCYVRFPAMKEKIGTCWNELDQKYIGCSIHIWHVSGMYINNM